MLKPQCQAHGRSILHCLACYPRAKKRYPKGFKACRCKMVLIPKDMDICVPCTNWETQDWLEEGPRQRRRIYALISL